MMIKALEVSTARIFEFIDVEEMEVGDSTPDGEIKGNIEFEDVEFSYDGETPMIRKVSFSVE